MSFQDKEIQCAECGATFTFTIGEQEFYAAKGYTNEPKRCPACRQARKTNRMDGGEQRRQLYPAICAECGKEAMLPFEPREGRPVYCRDCYDKIRLSS